MVYYYNTACWSMEECLVYKSRPNHPQYITRHIPIAVRVSDYERKVVQQLCEKQHVAWK